METLGDILANALKGHEMTMRVYDVRLGFETHGKKIEAIRNIRDAFSCGLSDAKAFIENHEGIAQVDVRLNERQLGRFSGLAFRHDAPVSFWIHSVTEVAIPPTPRLDYSHIA